MKKEHPLIKWAILVGVILISFFVDIGKYLDNYVVYYPMLLIFFIIWTLIANLKYRQGYDESLVRIPTSNESYYNALQIIIGTLTIITAVLLIIYSNYDLKILIQVIIIGLLFIVARILNIPGGYIKIKKGKLTFINGDDRQWMELSHIEKIQIHRRKVVICDKSEKVHYINYLKLKESDREKIRHYLRVKSKDKFSVEIIQSQDQKQN